MIGLEYQNLKPFLQKAMFQICLKKLWDINWSEEVLVIKKVKSNVPWTYVISDLEGEKIVGTFYEKENQIQIKNCFELKK